MLSMFTSFSSYFQPLTDTAAEGGGGGAGAGRPSPAPRAVPPSVFPRCLTPPRAPQPHQHSFSLSRGWVAVRAALSESSPQPISLADGPCIQPPGPVPRIACAAGLQDFERNPGGLLRVTGGQESVECDGMCWRIHILRQSPR